jgi:hypothetical protein
VFDTTGVGYFEVGKTTPEIADLNLALTKGRAGKGITIRAITEVELPKPAAAFEISIAGLG